MFLIRRLHRILLIQNRKMISKFSFIPIQALAANLDMLSIDSLMFERTMNSTSSLPLYFLILPLKEEVYFQ